MGFSTPIHTNEQSIDRVLSVGLPVLLVFERKDCPACPPLDKELARLAVTFEDRALIAKVNSDDNPKIAADYHVRATPTLVFVRDGQAIGRAVGAQAGDRLGAALEALAGGAAIPGLPEGQHTPLHGHGSGVADGPRVPGAPQTLTDATFEAAIKGDKPVLVDFWAPWCGPCRAIAPSVETLAREFAGRAVVAKLNIDENQLTASRFNVRSIPTLLVFKGGRVVDQIVGAQPITALRQALARHV